MTFVQLIELLGARWKLILACGVVSATLAFAISSLLPKTYTATAAVIVDTRALDVLGNFTTDRSHAANQSMVATQIDLISSERVARRVVAALGLDRDPVFRAQWIEESGSRGDIASFVARALTQKLDVKFNRDSNVIRLYFTGRNPGQVKEIVNRFAQESVTTNIDLKVDPATQTTAWFDERNRVLRERLTTAQDKLNAYQRQKGIVTRAEGGMDTENTKLQQLTSQLVDAQQAAADASSRFSQAATSPLSSPDILNNASISALRVSLGNAESTLQQLQLHYRDPYPQLQVAREEVATLRARVDAEVQAVVRSLRTSKTIADQRQASARSALDTQKKRVLSLMNEVSDAAVLRSDVESAQLALDTATTRQSQTALESKAQQSILSLLSLADEPYRPSSPRMRLNAAVSSVLGLLIGMGAALWLEARKPLVRRVEDVLAGDFEVLASLPHLRITRRLAPVRRQLTHHPATP